MNSTSLFLTPLTFRNDCPIQLNITIKMHYSKFNNKKTGKYSEKRRGYMEEKKVSISQVIAIGGAFMGFVIGSSFASGQECM